MQTINKLAQGLIDLINQVLVPLVFAVAFLLFLYGVFKYFFLGASDDSKRKEGRQFIMWSVIALAVMISVWGLVRVFAGTFSLDSETRPCLPTFTGGKTNCPAGTAGTNVGNDFTTPGTTGVTCVTQSGTTVRLSESDCREYGGTVQP